MQNIKVTLPEEKTILEQLAKRTDAEARRIERFLVMPDLSRTADSPLAEMVQRILAIPDFKDFDILEIPEIVPADISFDLFDFPADHPARSKSDTYYVDEKNILRTHTTVMWYYHMLNAETKKRMAAGEAVGGFSFGKVYRKDEIDRHHMNVFHQIDGWYLAPKEKQIIGEADLKKVLSEIAKAIFGVEVKYRFNPDTFPYTHPSLEMEVQVKNDDGSPSSGDFGRTPPELLATERGAQWVEVLGSGVVKGSVLEKFGIDSSKWTGWAFGFGLERLAILSMDLPDIRLLWSQDERVKKQLKLGNQFKEVSKYPPITRDISFVVDKNFVPNDYFDLIRDSGGDLVEEVKLLDSYENEEKFGSGTISYTYRIVYRSNERTLLSSEIDPIQAKVYSETATQFKAELR